jgi:hypothetical protein
VQQERRFQLQHAATGCRNHTGSRAGTVFHGSGSRKLRHVAGGKRFGHDADEQWYRRVAGQWLDSNKLLIAESGFNARVVTTYG